MDTCLVRQVQTLRPAPVASFPPCGSPGSTSLCGPKPRPPLCAVGRVVLTVDPTEARGAGARVAGHAVGAVGAVVAGVAGTLVDVLLAEGALEAGQAVAEGHVDAVCAGAAIVARVWGGTEGRPEGQAGGGGPRWLLVVVIRTTRAGLSLGEELLDTEAHRSVHARPGVMLHKQLPPPQHSLRAWPRQGDSCFGQRHPCSCSQPHPSSPPTPRAPCPSLRGTAGLATHSADSRRCPPRSCAPCSPPGSGSGSCH